MSTVVGHPNPPLLPGFPYRVLDPNGRYLGTLVVEQVKHGPRYLVRWLGQQGRVELDLEESRRIRLERGRWL